nr:hypothetical protein [Tanacetum cinerariifolium]
RSALGVGPRDTHVLRLGSVAMVQSIALKASSGFSEFKPTTGITFSSQRLTSRVIRLTTDNAILYKVTFKSSTSYLSLSKSSGPRPPLVRDLLWSETTSGPRPPLVRDLWFETSGPKCLINAEPFELQLNIKKPADSHRAESSSSDGLTAPKMAIISPFLISKKELAIPEQSATGKESINPLMADSLPKTIMPTKLIKSTHVAAVDSKSVAGLRFSDDYSMLLVRAQYSLIYADFSSILFKNQSLWYIVPTGRVIVPTGRYVVPTGRVIVPTGRIVSPGKSQIVIP